MGLVIGMDEAGYGPNLGPLVVTVTAWEVPGHPRDTDLWKCFCDVVTSCRDRGDTRLHIADSKQVYQPAKGLGTLERGVLAALRLRDAAPATLRGLLRAVRVDDAALEVEPWFAGADLPLPSSAVDAEFGDLATRWQACCAEHGVRLRAIHSDVVLTGRFNQMLDDHGSKGVALSRTSLRLLREVWEPDDPQPVWIIADKHGGRNRYDQLLDEILDGRMIFRVRESLEQSVYRVGKSELRFQTKAETHLPVALASMVCKYIRELSMELFNRYWTAEVDDLAPTRGYPTDAHRFRRDIADAQQRLGIPDAVLWRNR